jgi:hypothetical protein
MQGEKPGLEWLGRKIHVQEVVYWMDVSDAS